MSVLIAMPHWARPSELWMQRMIAALDPEVAAIAAYEPPETHWQGAIPAVPLPYVALPRWKRVVRRLGWPLRITSNAQALRQALADPAITVILAHYLEFALNFEDIWAGTDKPLFVHCHGYDVTWDLRYHERPEKRFFPAAYLPAVRRLARRARIIANSQQTARILRNAGIPSDRITVKYLGVPVPERPPLHAPRTQELQILSLGRLIDCKGPDRLIQAFEIACARGLDGRLILAGDGPMRARCEALRAASRYADRIALPGAVDAETGARLRAEADIFAAHNCFGPLSHQEEALGVSVIEAMADALPVVSGRSGGLMETVVPGETGILFEPGDIEANADALLTLAQNPDLRRRMGEAGWERARDHFSAAKERAELRRILGLTDARAEAHRISRPLPYPHPPDRRARGGAVPGKDGNA